MLQTQHPIRSDLIATPRNRNSRDGDSPEADCDQSKTNVMSHIVNISPKFIMDGIQQLRDITEASSLRFTMEEGESNLIS